MTVWSGLQPIGLGGGVCLPYGAVLIGINKHGGMQK